MRLPRALLRLPALVPLLALLLAALGGSAGAATTTVSVQDFSFTPARVTVGLGRTVTWVFNPTGHTTTSNQGFWDSGLRRSTSFVVTFRDAGTFGYHCSMHPEMTGKVRVPLTATGSAARGWKLRWSTRTSTPSHRRFDVQFKRAGATTWTRFRHATARRAGMFDPARAGSYVVRARTRNVGVGSSGWSPTLTVRIS
jgi:plastocyanin